MLAPCLIDTRQKRDPLNRKFYKILLKTKFGVSTKWAHSKFNLGHAHREIDLISHPNYFSSVFPYCVQHIFFFFFVGPRSILWGHWYPLFWTLDDTVHGFQSQGAFIVACALLSLAHNDTQSHLWLPVYQEF